MGVLNVTPDSFSDGGLNWKADGLHHGAAIERGLAMARAGADIIDVGGESTRPGATPLDVITETARVVPVVAGLVEAGLVVAVDTMKPEVARAAVDVGAEILNDVSGLRDGGMRSAAAALECGVVIVHMRGTPPTMQSGTDYKDVVGEVRLYLGRQADLAVAAGVAPSRICIDPGIGFGKSHHQNLEILSGTGELVEVGFPVMVGASRKGFLGSIMAAAGYPADALDRDPATGATVALAIAYGASVVRVHNVPAAVQAARTADAIVRRKMEDKEKSGRT